MILRIFDDAEELYEVGANIIANLICTTSEANLGLATGTSPVGIYRKLVEVCQRRGLSFRNVSTYNLDEYVGLPKSHPNSFYREMENNLFQHIDIDRSNVHIPDGEAGDLRAECERYNALLARVQPLDLQVLGIGENGHIGFNEPNHELSSGCHIVSLSEETRTINSIAFDDLDKVPTRAITMGVGDILKSKLVLFIAMGDRKAEIVKRAFQGPVTTMCPGSLLQLHSNVVALLDTQAASLLS